MVQKQKTKEKCFALSTTDNPWNPITQFDEWYLFDEVVLGHHTCSYLARIANTSPTMSDSAYDAQLEWAIGEILKYDILGIVTDGAVHYTKVVQ